MDSDSLPTSTNSSTHLAVIFSLLQQWVHGCSLVEINGQQCVGLTEEAAHEAAWIISDGSIKTGGSVSLVERLGFGNLSNKPEARAYFSEQEADKLLAGVSM